MGNEAIGLSAVEVGGHPRQLQTAIAEDFFPQGRSVVEKLLRVVKGMASIANPANLIELGRSERECTGRDLPSFVGKKLMFGQGVLERLKRRHGKGVKRLVQVRGFLIATGTVMDAITGEFAPRRDDRQTRRRGTCAAELVTVDIHHRDFLVHVA